MSDGALSTYLDAARRRRAAVADDLALLEKRERDVNIAFADATAQLRTLTLVVEALAAERLDIQEQAASLRERLRDIPTAFDPRILQRLPVELLRAVFDELASEPDPWVIVPDRVAFNAERAKTPFRLASVCRRWRNVALDMPGLWTYIALPVLSVNMRRSTHGAQLHIQRLLKRSGSRPLDVLLRWAEDHARWSGLPTFREMVSLVSQHIRRWRRACFDFPLGIDADGVEFLRCPAPLLEEFAIWSAGDAMLPSDSLPEYLPNSPRLKRFCSGTIFLAPRAPLPSLTQAHITCDTHPASAIWDAIGKMPALEDLTLTFLHLRAASVELPITELCLPVLRSLAIYGDPFVARTWASMLRLPRVQKLTLPTWSVAPLEPLLETALADIVELTLIADYYDDIPRLNFSHVQILGALLTRLQHLELARGIYLMPRFLDPLVGQDGAAAMLPELSALVLRDLSMLDSEAESIVAFVKARQGIVDAAGGPDSRPNVVLSVELTQVHAPVWFVPQLESILGERLSVKEPVTDSSSRFRDDMSEEA